MMPLFKTLSQNNFAAVNFWPADGVLAQLIVFIS